VQTCRGSNVWLVCELSETQKIRFENIIDMGLQWSTMMRLFEEGSKGNLFKQIIENTAEEIFNTKSRMDFVKAHAEFCDWGSKNTFLAEKERKGRIVKQRKLASYGQIAKTLDVTLKVAVYYCHLPDCERAKKISDWLNAAVDTRMMAMLEKAYPDEIKPWPARVEDVQKNEYLKIQGTVLKFKEKHRGQILPVQFDDIYQNMLNP
jgi:hypothetical protein